MKYGSLTLKANSKHFLPYFCLAGLVLVCLASQAFGEDECEDCTKNRFPEAEAFLAQHGYPPSDYDVLLSWRERGRTFAAGTVIGYRVAPLQGGEPFDLYSNESGKLLPDSEIRAAGIKKKSWDLRPVEQRPEVAGRVSKFTQAKPRAVGPAKGAKPGEWILLDPLDMGKVMAEDLEREQSASKNAKRIGVFQYLPQEVIVNGAYASEGEWQTLADGTRLWNLRIYSPEAVAQRIHFTALDLPRGAHVSVYNASYPEEAYGPYTALYPGEDDLWAASCFSDAVAVECVVPADVPLDPVRIAIDKSAHIYVDFAKLQWTKGLNDAGSCNLDVACYPDWLETSWGVGGIGSISRTGVLWCTGSLIADSDHDTEIPYFLTAAHCVGNDYEANTVEVYWLWQRDSCAGTLSPVYTVPRTTGGAEHEAGIADSALLRLRNQPPDGLTYLGWSAAPQELGTGVTCIHHPRGDYKRISFGALTPYGSNDSSYDPDFYHKVVWSDGTTEPGSSGSPLLRTDTQQIIGQLYGGYASCTWLDGPDFYGRFDVTYTIIEPWLGPIEPAGPADINKDGSLDASDVQLVINAALGLPVNPDHDPNVDGDPEGLVTAVDIQLVVNAALGK